MNDVYDAMLIDANAMSGEARSNYIAKDLSQRITNVASNIKRIGSGSADFVSAGGRGIVISKTKNNLVALGEDLGQTHPTVEALHTYYSEAFGFRLSEGGKNFLGRIVEGGNR